MICYRYEYKIVNTLHKGDNNNSNNSDDDDDDDDDDNNNNNNNNLGYWSVDLWWTKLHCDRFIPSASPSPVSINPPSLRTHSFANGAM